MFEHNRKYILTVAILFALLSPASYIIAHTEKPALIIDTDMALDDVRAVSLILGCGDYYIAGIVVTEGSATVETGFKNLVKILTFFDKSNDIHFFAGKVLKAEAPPWRAIAEAMDIPGPNTSPFTLQEFSTSELLKTIEDAPEKITYLCLGPMTNLAAALKAEPKISEKIQKIIFYGSSPDSPNKDFNYTFDSEAADFVFSLGIPMTVVSTSAAGEIVFDEAFKEKLKSIPTLAANIIYGSHDSENVKRLIGEKHLKLWDDIAAIYFLKPGLFGEKTTSSSNIRLVDTYDKTDVISAYLKLLNREAEIPLEEREAVTLQEFPTESELFRDDVKPYVNAIIERHGLEEWKACLLTNELHRHLGGYSIIGAKMGIRAREILGAPFDELTVVSNAGSEPPLSCLNDGLQVSTGASIGRGTITVAVGKNEPSAEFIYKGKKIKLTIRKEIIARITNDIKATAEKYGWLTGAYYDNLRVVAVRYWLEFDRDNILIEE
jgi:pyrimidine-specific ribonucleoside hydrolase